MKESIIAVFFEDSEPLGYPFNIDLHLDGYKELDRELKKSGSQIHIVRNHETYQGANLFSKSWVFNKNEKLEESGPISVDLLWDKSTDPLGFIPAEDFTATLLNDKELDKMARDKWQTAKVFPEVSPKTKKVKNYYDWTECTIGNDGKRIVIKPIDGEGAYGVQIKYKNEIDPTTIPFPCLVQEFLDSSEGIPGNPKVGVHDVRFVVANGDVIQSLIRKASPKTLIASVTQGGSTLDMKYEEIPKEAFDFIAQFDKKMEQYGTRLYSVDVAFTPEGIKLIEMNSRPGISCSKVIPSFEQTLQKMAEFFVKCIQ